MISPGTTQRGDRLNPPKSSRTYWVLTCLRRELEAVASSFESHLNQSRLVDYGCGNMPYRPLFEPHVSRYVGCDLSENTLADQHIGPTGRLPFEDGDVDVVLSNQVLEHVERPIHYLSEARRILRNDGLLILSTHGVWRYHPDPTDLWRWTSDGLKCELTRSGFEVVHFTGLLGPRATALQLLQDAGLSRIHWRLQRVYTRIMQWRIKRADLASTVSDRQRDACVYVAVAIKRGNQP